MLASLKHWSGVNGRITKEVDLKCPECGGQYFGFRVTYGFHGIEGWIPRVLVKCIDCRYAFDAENYKPSGEPTD